MVYELDQGFFHCLRETAAGEDDVSARHEREDNHPGYDVENLVGEIAVSPFPRHFEYERHQQVLAEPVCDKLKRNGLR